MQTNKNKQKNVSGETEISEINKIIMKNAKTQNYEIQLLRKTRKH